MLFNSLSFIIFFIIVTFAYFLLPHRYRWMLILAASCYFYMSFIPKFILILAATIIIDYFAGIGLEKFTGNKRKWLLAASLIANIGLLAFFKYFNFVNANLLDLANFIGWHYPIQALEIILPIGLSFHTFQSLSYTIEVYKGRQKAERHFGILAEYVLFYPQLVAGPIERPQNILPQLHAEHKFDYQRVTDGLKWMAWGMFKKVVIADRMSLLVNPVYESPGDYSGPMLVFATLAFSIQIYCDFSGYSDIALGSAQVMGIKLMKNFSHPYFAKSVPEFWQRWHIALSTWLRDYVHIPLSRKLLTKNRESKRLKWVFSLLVTFLVSGLWHGAAWTFVIWGALHGAYMVFTGLAINSWRNISTKFSLRIPQLLTNSLSRLFTFLLVSYAWIFFRASNIADAKYISANIFVGWHSLLATSHEIYTVLINGLAEKGLNNTLVMKSSFAKIVNLLTPESPPFVLLTLFPLLIFLVIEIQQYNKNFLEKFNSWPKTLRWLSYAALIATTLIFGTTYANTSGQSFIYFQF